MIGLVLWVAFLAPAVLPLPTGSGHVVTLEAPQPPSLGRRDAPVTIEVVLQPGLSYSTRAVSLARRVQARARDVRLVILPTSAGQASWEPTIECIWEAAAEGPDRLTQLLDRLERLSLSSGAPQPAELTRLGIEAGLDIDRLRAALADRRHLRIAERLAQGLASTARGGGELRVNGRRVFTGTDEAAVMTAVRDGRERATRLREEGIPPARLAEELSREAARDEAARRASFSRTPPLRTTIALAAAPTRGPRLAKVTVALFCGLGVVSSRSCADMLLATRRLMQRYPEVQVAWKNWTQSSSSTGDMQVNELTAAASVQGRLWELVDAWLAAPSPRPMTRATLDPLAISVGITPPTIRNSFVFQIRPADPKTQPPGLEAMNQLIAEDRADAQRLGLMWRPGVWVGRGPTGVLLGDAPLDNIGEADSSGRPSSQLELRVVDELELGLGQRLPPAAKNEVKNAAKNEVKNESKKAGLSSRPATAASPR